MRALDTLCRAHGTLGLIPATLSPFSLGSGTPTRGRELAQPSSLTVAVPLTETKSIETRTTRRRHGRSWLLALCALFLAGCNSLLTEGSSTVAGVGGAALSAAVTHNGPTAAGIGLGVQAGTRALLQYSERVAHGAEQDAIAQAAGPLPVGGVAVWSIEHTVAVEPDEHGRVTVSRVFGAPLLDCKEIVFSVDEEQKPDHESKSGSDQKSPPDANPDLGPSSSPPSVATASEFFVATVCRDGEAWRWALAEPSTSRWGSLQ